MAIIMEDILVGSNYELIITIWLQSHWIAIEWQQYTDIKTGLEMDAIGKTYKIKWLSCTRSDILPYTRTVCETSSKFNFLIKYRKFFSISFIKFEACPENVQPLWIWWEWFAQHQCNLAAKESGLECTWVNNDDFTVVVSGGSRHSWVSMCTVWSSCSKWLS